ncbi:MAG: acyl carrier protein [Clostridia bacterium]|nr:acyl carrier protein [Clostridia bacterium]
MNGKMMLDDDQLEQVVGGFAHMQDDVEERVIKIVAECLDIDVNSVSRNSNLVMDLNADGLDILDIMKEIDNAFNIQFSERTVSLLVTVGDIISAIENDM